MSLATEAEIYTRGSSVGSLQPEYNAPESTLVSPFEELDNLARQYETILAQGVTTRADTSASLSLVESRIGAVIDAISQHPSVNTMAVRSRVNGRIPDSAYEAPGGLQLQGILFLLSQNSLQSPAQARTIARYAEAFVALMQGYDFRRREIEEKLTIFSEKFSIKQEEVSPEAIIAHAVEHNTKEFEELRLASGTAHLQAIATPRIELKLRKATEYHARYEKEKAKLAELEARPAFIEFTRYDHVLDQHVAHRVPDPDVSAKNIAKKRRTVAAHRGLAGKLAKEIKEQNWESVRDKYQKSVDKTALKIDKALEKMAGGSNFSAESAVGAVQKMAKNTADAVAAPFIIDRMIHFLKLRGLYAEIDTVMPSLRDFAKRSLTAFLPDETQLSQKDIQKHTDDMFRYSTLSYVRNVLLSEARTDGFYEYWKMKTDRLEPRHMTKRMTRAVFDIYRLASHMQHSTVSGAFEWLKQSLLLSKGGILEYHTNDPTIYSTGKGPFRIGSKELRPGMLIASLPGISNNALYHLPLVDKGMFNDPRLGIAVETAREKTMRSGFNEFINDPKKKIRRVIHVEIERAQMIEVPHPEQHIEKPLKEQPLYKRQWEAVSSVVKELLYQRDPEVHGLLEKIYTNPVKHAAEATTLMRVVLSKLPPELHTSLFAPGNYDSATQLAGMFIGQPETYIVPAKKRAPDGSIYKTFVVVFNNPLTATSSFDGKH